MHFDLAFSKDDTSGLNYFNRGLVQSKLHSYKQANSDFNKALALFGQEKEKRALEVYFCRYNLGINNRKQGKLEQSISELRHAIDLQPEKPSAHNNLGLSLFEKGDFEGAIGHFGKAIKLEATAVHHNNRGLAHFHAQNPELALADFDKALEYNTAGDPTIYFNRGNALLTQN